MALSKLDIFKPLPEELKGKYDVVHLRFFMAVAVDDNVHIVIKNLKNMLSKYNIILIRPLLVRGSESRRRVAVPAGVLEVDIK